jgi:hypothetical protein
MHTTNTRFKLAYDFADKTGVSLFLTGKAGTGKTTLLQQLKVNSRKKIAITAPTGIAAMHAGGTTLHSFLQLPIQPYLSNYEHPNGLQVGITKAQFLSNLRMNKDKITLIRELELLVIDEVSMVRCDLFEAASDALKFIRKNNQPFGGLPVLLLGDLFQLPPVVIEHEMAIIEEVYKGKYFFDAPVYKELNPIYIELNHIYRQEDDKFKDLLNAIRVNTLLPEHKTILGSLLRQKNQEAITLTTHNRVADELNRAALNQLSEKLFHFHAEVQGDFSEKSFPTEATLSLKKGAKVMFVKNDTSGEKRYYNGMLATIDDINEDLIIVRTTDKQIKIELEKEKWKNIRYSLNKETSEIDEEETGSFTQFPIRLAWAITIHKSQGLTFENINIDAGSSFASGQVYVALSRCRSLDGISLLTPIQGEQILVDERVVDFHQKQVDEDLLEAMLEEAAYNYSVTKLLSAIKFHQVDLWIQQFTYAWHETLIEKYEAANALFLQLKNASSHLHLTGEKFLIQLNQLLSSKENDLITERILKAKQYFSYYLFDELIKPIQSFQDSIAKAKRVKLLNADLNKLINDLWKKLNDIQ